MRFEVGDRSSGRLEEVTYTESGMVEVVCKRDSWVMVEVVCL